MSVLIATLNTGETVRIRRANGRKIQKLWEKLYPIIAYGKVFVDGVVFDKK